MIIISLLKLGGFVVLVIATITIGRKNVMDEISKKIAEIDVRWHPHLTSWVERGCFNYRAHLSNKALKRVFEDFRFTIDQLKACREETTFTQPDADYNTWQCTKCGWDWDLLADTPKENMMNYCPYCGRKIIYDQP
jgi:DNA-directed RNA polymerase subunit RPC12/RpoP